MAQFPYSQTSISAARDIRSFERNFCVFSMGRQLTIVSSRGSHLAPGVGVQDTLPRPFQLFHSIAQFYQGP